MESCTVTSAAPGTKGGQAFELEYRISAEPAPEAMSEPVAEARARNDMSLRRSNDATD